jgi:hypothetical protein
VTTFADFQRIQQEWLEKNECRDDQHVVKGTWDIGAVCSCGEMVLMPGICNFGHQHMILRTKKIAT